MKRKIAFWIVMILANAIIGAISVKTYQKLEARVTGVETHQKNYDETYLRNYNDKFGELTLAHQKTVAELLRALGVDGKYDFNNNLVRVWDLNKFLNYKVYVRTGVVLEVPEELRESNSDSAQSVVKVSEAPAIIIGRYVLMASHVSDAEILSLQTVRMMTPVGEMVASYNLKVLEYKATFLLADGSKCSLKELYRNKEKDFSLFEIIASPEGETKNVSASNFPFEIGKSDELKIGHFIYINGRPRINSEVARPGYVTSLVRASLGDASEVKKDDSEFGISQSTDQGDSSSPIVALRDGRPELVGIYLGWIGTRDDNGENTRSRALKINVVIDEIKAKLGIDLREIQRQILYKH